MFSIVRQLFQRSLAAHITSTIRNQVSAIAGFQGHQISLTFCILQTLYSHFIIHVTKISLVPVLDSKLPKCFLGYTQSAQSNVYTVPSTKVIRACSLFFPAFYFSLSELFYKLQ